MSYSEFDRIEKDLTDLLEIICEKENDLDLNIINNARNTYNNYLNKSTGGNLFCERLKYLVKDLLSIKPER